jgi:hypothetical protein
MTKPSLKFCTSRLLMLQAEGLAPHDPLALRDLAGRVRAAVEDESHLERLINAALGASTVLSPSALEQLARETSEAALPQPCVECAEGDHIFSKLDGEWRGRRCSCQRGQILHALDAHRTIGEIRKRSACRRQKQAAA